MLNEPSRQFWCMFQFENHYSKWFTDLWGMAPWRMSHKSLRYKIKTFHQLEPPCCMRCLTNLPYNTYVSYQPEEHVSDVGIMDYEARDMSPLPDCFPLTLDSLCSWNICWARFSAKSLICMCLIWQLIFCVSSENRNQHVLKMKKDIIEIRGHHIYGIVLWRLPQYSHSHSLCLTPKFPICAV